MYLTELFFNSLYDHYDKGSVEYAIEKCNEEMLNRIGKFDTVQDTVMLCFGENPKAAEATQAFQELMEFREMLELFRELIPYEYGREFKILQVIEESYSIYQYLINRSLIAEFDKQERKNLWNLFQKIEDLCRNNAGLSSKKIIFFSEKNQHITVESTLPLTGFLEEKFSGQKLSVKNRLMLTMKSGGVAAVVFGTEEEPVQKLFGFILIRGQWRCCSNMLELYLMRQLLEEE